MKSHDLVTKFMSLGGENLDVYVGDEKIESLCQVHKMGGESFYLIEVGIRKYGINFYSEKTIDKMLLEAYNDGVQHALRINKGGNHDNTN